MRKVTLGIIGAVALYLVFLIFSWFFGSTESEPPPPDKTFSEMSKEEQEKLLLSAGKELLGELGSDVQLPKGGGKLTQGLKIIANDGKTEFDNPKKAATPPKSGGKN